MTSSVTSESVTASSGEGISSPVVFDGHNDVLLALRSGRSFWEESAEGHIDLPRARRGRLGGGFCAVFPSVGEDKAEAVTYTDALPYTIAQMARLFRLENESDGSLRVVRTVAEIDACLRSGTFAALLHMEGAEAIDPDLESLEVFYQAGLRSLGPVWSRPTAFGHGVPFRFPHHPDTGPGLTEAGERLVRACNRLRIVIDLSHLNEKGFWDVARISQAPLVATHSNAHALCPATRNLTDRQLDAIRDSDGMVGVNFHCGFLRADGAGDADTLLDVVVDHVDYLVGRLGIGRVGLGSDFDGAVMPRSIADAAGLPHLFDALRQRGYDEEALTKIAHGNWLRVLRLIWGE